MPITYKKSSGEEAKRKSENNGKSKTGSTSFLLKLAYDEDADILSALENCGNKSDFVRKCMLYYLWAEQSDPRFAEFQDRDSITGSKRRRFLKAKKTDSGSDDGTAVRMLIRGKYVIVEQEEDGWVARREDMPSFIARGSTFHGVIDKYYRLCYSFFRVLLDRDRDADLLEALEKSGNKVAFARRSMRYYLWTEQSDPRTGEYIDRYFANRTKLGHPFGGKNATATGDAAPVLQTVICGKKVTIAWNGKYWQAGCDEIPYLTVKAGSIDETVRRYAEALKTLNIPEQE